VLLPHAKASDPFSGAAVKLQQFGDQKMSASEPEH